MAIKIKLQINIYKNSNQGPLQEDTVHYFPFES